MSFRDFGALPFLGPAAALNLDSELDEISRARGLDSKTAQTLRSVAGKNALWQAIANHILERRDLILGEALERQQQDTPIAADAGAATISRLAAVYRPLFGYVAELRPDIASLDRILQPVAETLKQDSELATRLGRVLQQPGAAEAVYLSFVYPAYLATGGLPGIEDKLVRGDPDEGGVGADPEIQAMLDNLKPLLAPVKRLADETVRDAAQISDRDALHKIYRNALSDPMTTAVSASIQVRRNPGISPEQLQTAVSRGLNQNFTRSGNSRVLIGSVDRNDAEKRLRLLGRLRALAAGSAGGIGALFADMDNSIASNRELMNALSSDLAAASVVPASAFESSMEEFFFRSSIFGSSLLKGNDGSWSINPHRKREAGIAVSYLERRLYDYQTHKDLLAKKAEVLGSSEAERRLVAYIMLQIAELENLRDVDGLARQWINAHFEISGGEYRLREGMSGRLDEIARSVESNGSPLTVDLRDGAYKREHLELFRSSAYIYLGSPFARDVYFNEFDDHYAVRLWGIFDWNAQESRSPAEFRQALSKQADFLRHIARTHEKVVIYVFHTPEWLSASRDRHAVDGRPAYLLHSPRDYAAWRQFVGETATFLKQHLEGTDVYYEFWNEPEIYWPEGNAEFLRLYAETARAIRQQHPDAKIGGATVNGWDGTVRKAGGGTPLNFELIKYAVNNNVPLDFIAWHHFERPVSEIEKAKQAYIAELRKLGVKTTPEFVISEWSIPGRGSSIEAMAFAEYMLGFYRSEVDVQAVSAWDEFSVLARPNYFAPWGMITHQGLKKPMFHVHDFFDRLSRDSSGIAVFETEDEQTRVVVSRKRDGSFELVAWERRYSQRLEQAIKSLQESGLDAAEIREYGDLETLEAAIRDAKPGKRGHEKAFRKASDVYQSIKSDNPLVLHLNGSRNIRVTAAEAVGVRLIGRQVFSSGPNLSLNLPRGEVMWLRVEVD